MPIEFQEKLTYKTNPKTGKNVYYFSARYGTLNIIVTDNHWMYKDENGSFQIKEYWDFIKIYRHAHE